MSGYWLFRPCLKSFVALILLNRLRLPPALRLPLPYANPKPKSPFFFNLTLGHTRKVLPPPRYKGWGVDETPLDFLICCSISKRFCYKWKAFDLLQNTRYILWVVALLEVCEITKHGRHFVFYQELEIR